MVWFGPAKNRERRVSGSLTSVILSFPLFRKKEIPLPSLWISRHLQIFLQKSDIIDLELS